MAATVEVYHDPTTCFNLHRAGGLDKLAIQDFRFALVITMQLARKPTITAVG